MLRGIIYLFYNLKLLVFYNKLKELTFIKKIIFLLIYAIGLVLVIVHAFQKRAFYQEEISLTYYVIIYILVRVIFFSNLRIKNNDVILAELTNQKLNLIIGYNLFCKLTNIKIPLLLSLYVSIINNSIYLFFYSFLVLYLFLNTINALSCVIQIVRLIHKKFVIFIYISILLIGIAFYLFDPQLFYINKFLDPAYRVVFSFIYDCSTYQYQNSAFFFSSFILIYSLCIYICWIILKRYSFQLSFEDNVYSKEQSTLKKRKYVNTFIMIELQQSWGAQKKIKDIFYLIVPHIVYIIFTIYILHRGFSLAIEISFVDLLLSLWFGLLCFPVLYILPKFKDDLKYLWIYRHSFKGTINFLHFKLLMFYFLSIISHIISFLIIMGYSFVVLRLNYIEYIDMNIWISMIILLSLLFTLIGICIALFLPNAYYTYGNTLSFIPMVGFIWLISLLTFPIVYLVILGCTQSYIYLYGSFALLFCEIIVCYVFARYKLLNMEV